MITRIRLIAALAFLLGGHWATAQQMGKLLVLRNTGAQQSARACLISENEIPLARLSNQHAILLELPSGSHTLQTRLKSGPVMGFSVTSHPDGYTFYELKLYKTRGILPSSGYRFRLVPLSPKKLTVYLRDEDWLRRDLPDEEYKTLCKILKVQPLVGQTR